jgi:hypothetical protein
MFQEKWKCQNLKTVKLWNVIRICCQLLFFCLVFFSAIINRLDYLTTVKRLKECWLKLFLSSLSLYFVYLSFSLDLYFLFHIFFLFFSLYVLLTINISIISHFSRFVFVIFPFISFFYLFCFPSHTSFISFTSYISELKTLRLSKYFLRLHFCFTFSVLPVHRRYDRKCWKYFLLIVQKCGKKFSQNMWAQIQRTNNFTINTNNYLII